MINNSAIAWAKGFKDASGAEPTPEMLKIADCSFGDAEVETAYQYGFLAGQEIDLYDAFMLTEINCRREKKAA